MTIPYQQIADEFYEAEKNGIQIDPPSHRYPEFTARDAYLIQRINIQRRLDMGAHMLGRKVGATDKIMSQFDPIDCSKMVAPFIEAELCLVMGETLEGPGVTFADALRAVEGVIPAIEVVFGRNIPEHRKAIDSCADNASNVGFILGDIITDARDIDFDSIGVSFRRNHEIVAASSSAAVLDSPLNVIAWLANFLAPYGERLEKGSFIMTGSLTPITYFSPGDFFEADYGKLGTVRAKFLN